MAGAIYSELAGLATGIVPATPAGLGAARSEVAAGAGSGGVQTPSTVSGKL